MPGSPDGRWEAVTHPEAKMVSVVDLQRRTVIRALTVPALLDRVGEADPPSGADRISGAKRVQETTAGADA